MDTLKLSSALDTRKRNGSGYISNFTYDKNMFDNSREQGSFTSSQDEIIRLDTSGGSSAHLLGGDVPS